MRRLNGAMPSTPRARDAATVLAVVLTIALALLWLRSSDGAAPAVPAGLSVKTAPAAPAPAAAKPGPTGLGRRGGGSGAADTGARERLSNGAGERPRRAVKHGHAEHRRAPRATAPGPSVGSGTVRSAAPRVSGASEPEFALE